MPNVINVYMECYRLCAYCFSSCHCQLSATTTTTTTTTSTSGGTTIIIVVTLNFTTCMDWTRIYGSKTVEVGNAFDVIC